MARKQIALTKYTTNERKDCSINIRHLSHLLDVFSSYCFLILFAHTVYRILKKNLQFSLIDWGKGGHNLFFKAEIIHPDFRGHIANSAVMSW